MRKFKAQLLDTDLGAFPLLGAAWDKIDRCHELWELQKRTREILEGVSKSVPGSSYLHPAGVPAWEWVQIDDRGRIGVAKVTSAFEGLNSALVDVQPNRIRRCPVCQDFFYAARANKGACDEHLARARVQRGRDPELRRRYEQTRRINRLVRHGKPIGEAKSEVQRKEVKRRTVR